MAGEIKMVERGVYTALAEKWEREAEKIENESDITIIDPKAGEKKYSQLAELYRGFAKELMAI